MRVSMCTVHTLNEHNFSVNRVISLIKSHEFESSKVLNQNERMNMAKYLEEKNFSRIKGTAMDKDNGICYTNKQPKEKQTNNKKLECNEAITQK